MYKTKNVEFIKLRNITIARDKISKHQEKEKHKRKENKNGLQHKL